MPGRDSSAHQATVAPSAACARRVPSPYAAQPVIPRRLRRQRRLHDAGKLAAIVVLVGGGGVALGEGLSRLSGGSTATPGTTAAQPATTVAAVSTPTGAATGLSPPPPPQGRFRNVDVRAVSAVLHPAATAFGRQHNRARLTVLIVVQNRGTTRVTPTRPSLVAAGSRVPTDFHADAPGTRLGPLAAGSTASVDLVFELGGAETTQLTQQRRVRISVAGRVIQVPVKSGAPVAPPAAATTGATGAVTTP